MNNGEGSKYEETKSLDIAQIAQLVRQDIKAAIKDGSLPVGTKCSVKIQRYAGGKSLYVTIVGFHGQVETDEAVLYYASNDRDSDRPDEVFTPAAQAALDKIKDIRDSYNYDHSDIQSDYFSVRFYGEARFGQECTKASRSATIVRKSAETRAAAASAEAVVVVAQDRCDAAQARLAETEAQFAALTAKFEKARIERDAARAELAASVGCFAGHA